MKTAEWECTVCGATNRKLVRGFETETEDRCLTCGTRHRIEQDQRPVRWRATALP